MRPCRIPAPYLVDTKKFLAPELPEAPLIVFINSKSGGRAGPKLTEVLYHTLGHAQVCVTFCYLFLWNCLSGAMKELGGHDRRVSIWCGLMG